MRPLAMHKPIVGHVCTTVQKRGWAGIKNGQLLRRAESEFDLFVTSDQNIACQQNLSGLRIAIIQLSTNKLRRILAADILIKSTIVRIQPGEFISLAIA